MISNICDVNDIWHCSEQVRSEQWHLGTEVMTNTADRLLSAYARIGVTNTPWESTLRQLITEFNFSYHCITERISGTKIVDGKQATVLSRVPCWEDQKDHTINTIPLGFPGMGHLTQRLHCPSGCGYHEHWDSTPSGRVQLDCSR